MNECKNNIHPVHDVLASFDKFTSELEEEISKAGSQGERGKIFMLAEQLRRADDLANRVRAIEQEIRELLSSRSTNQKLSPVQLPPRIFPNENTRRTVSVSEHPKSRGKRLRMKWVAENGGALRHYRRTLYQNSHGEVVGIACATEKRGETGPEGRWWLGLPNGSFQHAVLLCETNEGTLHAVCLPKTFIQKYRGQFSQSSGGQEQFTVLKNGAKWYLQLPNIGPIEVTLYLDNPSHVI